MIPFLSFEEVKIWLQSIPLGDCSVLVGNFKLLYINSIRTDDSYGGLELSRIEYDDLDNLLN